VPPQALALAFRTHLFEGEVGRQHTAVAAAPDPVPVGHHLGDLEAASPALVEPAPNFDARAGFEVVPRHGRVGRRIPHSELPLYLPSKRESLRTCSLVFQCVSWGIWQRSADVCSPPSAPRSSRRRQAITIFFYANGAMGESRMIPPK